MKTILVVDDNKLSLVSARNVLQDEYKVISVMKGQQALTYLESGECDIVLLDINMPEMDGFEVLEKMREMERCRNLPVVFLTADNDPDTETKCFQKGALDFIAKPFVPEVMRSRIGRILEIEELRRSMADRLEEKNRVISDITNKSHQDALTGLWNRAYTQEKVDGLLKSGAHGAMLMIDVDNFKSINDNFGHIAGDRTLKILADVMRTSSAEGDILCRIGGDEFIVFIKDEITKEEVNRRAETIGLNIRRRIKECEFEIDASVSIGIAQAPEDGDGFDQLYSCADKALYFVKQNGKNACHFYSDRLQGENSRLGKTVDLKYLQELMNRADSGSGAYLLDFDSFHHVYNFIHRFIDRSDRDVQTLLYTVSEVGNEELDAEEAEYALELLEKAIYTSLRRSDVSTRYSSRQLIVILMDVNRANGDMVAERIIDNFNKVYTRGRVRVDYGIARMNTRG